MPSRRRSRPPSSEVRTPPLPSFRLASLEALDHSARRFGQLSRASIPVRYLIRTGLSHSRRLPQDLAGVLPSPIVGARASLRSRSVSGSPMFQRALDCANRSIRKEVLFALRRTAKGARSRRFRSNRSSVKCK